MTWDETIARLEAEAEVARVAARQAVGATISIPIEPGFYVYVHRGCAGEVLYVGSTTNPAGRMANHIANRRKSWWWPSVTSIEWERYDNNRVMLFREVTLITALRPVANVQNNHDSDVA